MASGRRGIGKQLLEHVQTILAECGCAVLISDVWKDARGVYEALGWSPPNVVLLRKTLR
ncbi:MAG TPA: GNAT family N-acetyltransferase [Verrucomicrobiae bacterium]|nr:GNAT family N-acetyltransferase [Verrucomicrobiae bacterium]